MNPSIELGYLRRRGRRHGRLRQVPRRRRRPRPRPARTAAGRRHGATTTRPSGSSCTRATPTTRRTSGSSPRAPRQFEAAVERLPGERCPGDRGERRPSAPPAGWSAWCGRRPLGDARSSWPWAWRRRPPFDSPLVPGGFLTEGIGFGHVVFATCTEEEFAKAHAFATEGLGFRQSDWIETDLGGIPVTVRFYHCNPRHHTLALAHVPFEVPQRLHHVMVETVSEDNVGYAFDRAWNAGLPIANGLGKHDNDRMFSFYVVTPAGFQLEFGTGAIAVDDDWSGDHRYDRISIWGHQPIPVAPPV